MLPSSNSVDRCDYCPFVTSHFRLQLRVFLSQGFSFHSSYFPICPWAHAHTQPQRVTECWDRRPSLNGDGGGAGPAVPLLAMETAPGLQPPCCQKKQKKKQLLPWWSASAHLSCCRRATLGGCTRHVYPCWKDLAHRCLQIWPFKAKIAIQALVVIFVDYIAEENSCYKSQHAVRLYGLLTW